MMFSMSASWINLFKGVLIGIRLYYESFTFNFDFFYQATIKVKFTGKILLVVGMDISVGLS